MNARILLVEDDSVLREQVTSALREAGHEVLDASEANQASLPSDEFSPDLLLLDLDYRPECPWDLYAEWKARVPDLRAVALTAESNRFGVARAVGLDALVEKPVDPSLLLLVVGSLLEQRNEGPPPSERSRRIDFRYLTQADARYWRGLRGRYARACQARTAPDNLTAMHN